MARELNASKRWVVSSQPLLGASCQVPSEFLLIKEETTDTSIINWSTYFMKQKKNLKDMLTKDYCYRITHNIVKQFLTHIYSVWQKTTPKQSLEPN